jgi:hypothetical protein
LIEQVDDLALSRGQFVEHENQESFRATFVACYICSANATPIFCA